MPLIGLEDAVKGLEDEIQRIWREAGVAWWDTIQQTVFIVSLNRVPVKTGTLKGTGRNDLVMDDSTIQCEVGYGSEAVNYALVQHEHVEFHHEVGEAKYLEYPVNEALPIIPEEFKKRMKGESVI